VTALCDQHPQNRTAETVPAHPTVTCKSTIQSLTEVWKQNEKTDGGYESNDTLVVSAYAAYQSDYSSKVYNKSTPHLRHHGIRSIQLWVRG